MSMGAGCAAALSPLVEPLIAVLLELAGVVGGISDEQYARAHDKAFGGTVGGHVRHSLDHVTAFLGGLATGLLDYDDRQRGTSIETSRGAALEEIDRAVSELRTLNPAALDQSIQVRTALTCQGPAVAMQCPARRELAFVLSHTVHHNAMIGAMVRAMGGVTPLRFGYAPSTVAHLQRQQQAQQPQEQFVQLQQEQQQQ